MFQVIKNIMIFVFMFCMTSLALADFGSRSCHEYNYRGNGLLASWVDGFAWDERRGSPNEFDPGPYAKEHESWLKLFGQVPNYREVGKAIMGGSDEKFRWQMGPMWYRGRLGKNQVKVFVIGQEGAQDENVTNRAFTGSTGTNVQKFLNHMGVYESYLFLNTFVYTIFGQRIIEPSEEGYANYVAMEQGQNSPIVKYRHQLFDNVVRQNPESLSLIMAVGGGAKDSLATWINSRSGNNDCDKEAIEKCDLSKLVKSFADEGVLKGDETILAFSVVHPGSAKFEGGAQIVRSSFGRAAKTVARYIENNPGWLVADSQEDDFAECNGGKRMSRLNSGDFQYGYAPIPFRDFAFGTNWRMGYAGTTSNRNGQDKILIFSEMGDYEESKVRNAESAMDFSNYYAPEEAKNQLVDINRGQVLGMKETEVPYEHPRYSEFGETQGDLEHVKQFDPGPMNEDMAKALMEWPNFQLIDNEAYVSHPSFGFSSIYRGNLNDPKVVILADQMSHTDMFSARALTGEGGQILQAWLEKVGMEKDSSYLILRPLPVDTLGVSTEKVLSLVRTLDEDGKSALKVLKKVLQLLKNKVKLVAMGPVSVALLEDLAKESNVEQTFIMEQPNNEFSHLSNWVQVADELGFKIEKSTLQTMNVIPRKDLPYSTRWWMGTTGELAQRGIAKEDREAENYNGHYYRLEAPWWINKLRRKNPRPLNSIEKSLVEELLEEINNETSSL